MPSVPRYRRFAAWALLTAGIAGTVALVVLGLESARGNARHPAGAPQGRLGPVLLVPGYGGNIRPLQQLAARLRATGRSVTVVSLPAGGTGDLNAQARTLAAAVRSARAGGAPSVDVVGYSAGGVVARLWARDDGGAAEARRVVTLGSPHHGTDLAALAGDVLPGVCPLACRQLAPGSDLLRALNAGDETPAGPQWLAVWTRDDRVVTPPDSGRLADAVDVQVQAVCPDDDVDHGALPTDPLVEGLVLRALSTEPLTTPTRADCGPLRALGAG